MADKQSEPKKVPPRNDLKSTALYKGSKADQLRNQDPDFVYEYKTTDENHPHCLKNSGQLQEHEYGKAMSGYVSVKGWEVCQRANGDKAIAAEVREDQGKPIDTLIRKGKQVLCRIPRSEHAKYAEADNAYTEMMEKQIFSPERMGDGTARMTALVSNDPSADQMKMLRDAGHPIPGIS